MSEIDAKKIEAQLSNEMIAVVEDFNNLVISLIETVSIIAPGSMVGVNKKLILKEAGRPSNKYIMIKVFVARVLDYKKQIDNEEEEFFLKKKVSGKDVENNQMAMDGIFEFREIWPTLRAENKATLFQHMQYLCALAQEFFLYVDEHKIKI